ncbi:DNA replication licensing factor MCM7 [Spironucleus salmonicida]|uniref:DNA helicase n=1 Tax=Spironucleus salmonicida TaxID=348837 RepID=V6LLV5_9EUKA|nr:DNA replication licensing factor MCM7 [Spironucleus salmonicida]|eukprot:EST45662.1 DNA replication licensing factor MCM7 [Spironucleus salmonicida]
MQKSKSQQQKNSAFTIYDFKVHKEILKLYLDEQLQNFTGKVYTIQLDDLIQNYPDLVQCILDETLYYIQICQELINPDIPEALHRKTQFCFQAPSQQPLTKFRDVPLTIGKLLKFNGTVTSASQILPNCSLATYYCENCKSQLFVPVTSDSFSPPKQCISEQCRSLPVQLQLQTVLSKFNDLRIYTIQEHPDEVPQGGTPRQVKVYHQLPTGAHNSSIRPGDRLQIQGFVIPMPTDQSIFAIEPILYLQHSILLIQVKNLISQPYMSKINELKLLPSEKLYNLLTNSFAPNLHHLFQPKLSCLCALVGGTPPNLKDIKIRPTINILLIGDPGLAKSQLLKATVSSSYRSNYVAGKGTSSAGLTAAAIRINNTSEFSIEPGALILADQGVCCIDEFDKIDEEDRSAIYEVLEQQTLSFSKGGVSATLNARTTVVAAANPKYSKWDSQLSFKDNVNLPEALISRFDIVFVMKDQIDEERDKDLGLFVGQMHMLEDQRKIIKETIDENILRAYLEEVKSIHARIQPEMLSRYVEGYCIDRAEKDFSTPRSLLSCVRISQALAKLRGSEVVQEKDIDAARSLLAAAEESAETTIKKQKVKQNTTSIVKGILKNGPVSVTALQKKCADKGIIPQDFEKIIQRLVTIEVIMLEKGKYSLK